MSVIFANTQLCRVPDDCPHKANEIWTQCPKTGAIRSCMSPPELFPNLPVFPEVSGVVGVWMHTSTSDYGTVTYIMPFFATYKLVRLLVQCKAIGYVAAMDIAAAVSYETLLTLDLPALKKLCGPKTGEALDVFLKKYRVAPVVETPPAPPKPKKHPHFDDLVGALKGMGQSATVAKACAERVVADPGTETMTLQQLIPLALQRPKA